MKDLSELKFTCAYALFISINYNIFLIFGPRSGDRTEEIVASIMLTIVLSAAFYQAQKAKSKTEQSELDDRESRRTRDEQERSELTTLQIKEHRTKYIHDSLLRRIQEKIGVSASLQVKVIDFKITEKEDIIATAASVHFLDNPRHPYANCFIAKIHRASPIVDLVFVDSSAVFFPNEIFAEIVRSPGKDLVESIETVAPLAETTFFTD